MSGISYIESSAAIERKEFKQLEFWMFKEDGDKLAKVLTRLFGCDTKERAADYFRPVRQLFDFGQSLRQRLQKSLSKSIHILTNVKDLTIIVLWRRKQIG